MKKTTTALLCAAVIAASGICTASAKAADWNDFSAHMEQQAKIRNEGAAFMEQLKNQAPGGDNKTLWEASCKASSPQERAAASYALMLKLLPNGDPSKWEEVKGFFDTSSYMPNQIVAVNALFNAVTALYQMPEGKYAAAYLMQEFGKSSRGKIIFIETTPKEFRATLDALIAETGLEGDWSSEKVEGPYPFVPRYAGVKTRQNAMTSNRIFLDGYGSIATNGNFAWDRFKKEIYTIIDPENS